MHYVLTFFVAICALMLNVGDALAQRAKKAKTPKQSARHMLWRLQTDSTVVYLMGSVHALPKEYYPLDTILDRSLDSSDVLVLEVALEESMNASVMQSMLLSAMLEQGMTLKDVLDDKTYALAAAKLKSNGADIGAFDRFEPWVLALMLSGLELKDKGFSGEHGVDVYFDTRAAAEAKERAGLETIEDQIEIFNSMSLATQGEFLRQTLKGSAPTTSSIVKLAAAWRSGDLKALEKLAISEMRKDSLLYERMLVARNRAWLPKIESYLADGSKRYLVVVGAAHLVGPDGLLTMLRARGFRPVQM